MPENAVTAKTDVFVRWIVGITGTLVTAGIIALLGMLYTQGGSTAAMKTSMAHIQSDVGDVKSQVKAIDSTQRTLIDSIVARVTRLEIEAAAMREQINRLQGSGTR